MPENIRMTARIKELFDWAFTLERQEYLVGAGRCRLATGEAIADVVVASLCSREGWGDILLPSPDL